MVAINLSLPNVTSLGSAVASNIPIPKPSAALKWLKGIGVGAGLLGAGAYITKETIIDPAVRASRIKKSLSSLIEKNPQLEEKDEEKIKDYFNIIKTFSPKSASNPLVAGALINKMMEFGGVDHKIVQDLASIESGFVRPTVGQAAAEGAAKAFVSFPGLN